MRPVSGRYPQTQVGHHQTQSATAKNKRDSLSLVKMYHMRHAHGVATKISHNISALTGAACGNSIINIININSTNSSGSSSTSRRGDADHTRWQLSSRYDAVGCGEGMVRVSCARARQTSRDNAIGSLRAGDPSTLASDRLIRGQKRLEEARDAPRDASGINKCGESRAYHRGPVV